MLKHLFATVALGMACQCAMALDPQAVVADPGNLCRVFGENRDACFSRRIVQKEGNQYLMTDYPFGCPPRGYHEVPSSLDDRLMDREHPDAVIYYYEHSEFTPKSQAELDRARASQYSCQGQDLGEFQTAFEGGCEAQYPAVMTVKGYVALRTIVKTWRMDTINQGPLKCKHYEAAGCPAWCSRWAWALVKYTRWQCARGGGPYPASQAMGEPVSRTASPTTVVCAKN